MAAPPSHPPRGAAVRDVLHSSLWPMITAFQHGDCPDVQRFFRWSPPLILRHPNTPPGRTYIDLIQLGLQQWYALHGVACLPRLFARKPDMVKITLVEAVVSGRLDVLEWFDQSQRLHDADLPLVAIAAWAGELDIIQFLDGAGFNGCGARATQWALANGHHHVVEYLRQAPRICMQCGVIGDGN